jgi:hypothetical protein
VCLHNLLCQSFVTCIWQLVTVIVLHLDAVRRRLDARLSAWTEVRQTPAPEHVSHNGAVSGSEQNSIDFVTVVVDFEAGFFYGLNSFVGSGNCMNVASDYSCSWCQISNFNWTPSLEWKLYAYFSLEKLEQQKLQDKGWGFIRTRSVGSFYVLLYVFYRSDGYFFSSSNETLVCRLLLVSCAMTRMIDEDLFPVWEGCVGWCRLQNSALWTSRSNTRNPRLRILGILRFILHTKVAVSQLCHIFLRLSHACPETVS